MKKKQDVMNYNPFVEVDRNNPTGKGTYKVRVVKGERVFKTKGDTEVQPNEGLDMRTIFNKWLKSGQVPGALMREGHDQGIEDTDDPEDLPDMQKVDQADLYDKDQLRMETEQVLKEKREKLGALGREQEKRRKEREKEIDESIEYNKRKRAEEEKAKGSAKGGTNEQA